MEKIETKAGGPKDVFLHLLTIVALYVSAGSFVDMVFNYVNIWLPDPVSENYYSLISAYSSIRWSIATLIVVFPVYVWATWFLNKSYSALPAMREMKTRKWLLYFTIFAAAGIIIGDLVTLIYNFLQGELTLRFLFKILTVLITSGMVFGYYILDLKNKAPHKIFAYAVSLIMIIAIVVGFFVVGSPKEERARKFDEQRISNLQFIQSEIINHWTQKGVLPKNLDELKDDIRGVTIPIDPENGSNYTYEVTGQESFKLCANFNRPSIANDMARTKPYPAEPYYYGQENWDHKEGPVCFDRKIDKDLYKPQPK